MTTIPRPGNPESPDLPTGGPLVPLSSREPLNWFVPVQPVQVRVFSHTSNHERPAVIEALFLLQDGKPESCRLRYVDPPKNEKTVPWNELTALNPHLCLGPALQRNASGTRRTVRKVGAITAAASLALSTVVGGYLLVKEATKTDPLQQKELSDAEKEQQALRAMFGEKKVTLDSKVLASPAALQGLLAEYHATADATGVRDKNGKLHAFPEKPDFIFVSIKGGELSFYCHKKLPEQNAVQSDWIMVTPGGRVYTTTGQSRAD